MAQRVSWKFNLLPRAHLAKTSLVAVVREAVARRGKKWLVSSQDTKLPKSLAEIGGIELRDWDVYGVTYGFIEDFCEKLLRLYAPSEKVFERELKDNLLFAVSELIKNAVLYGNRDNSSKKVLLSFDRIENGFVIDVFDEGKGPLLLLRSSSNFRDFAAWFRLGYGGHNCGIAGIQKYFGKESLTACKIYSPSGKRVGTRVRLFVQV